MCACSFAVAVVIIVLGWTRTNNERINSFYSFAEKQIAQQKARGRDEQQLELWWIKASHIIANDCAFISCRNDEEYWERSTTHQAHHHISLAGQQRDENSLFSAFFLSLPSPSSASTNIFRFVFVSLFSLKDDEWHGWVHRTMDETLRQWWTFREWNENLFTRNQRNRGLENI